MHVSVLLVALLLALLAPAHGLPLAGRPKNDPCFVVGRYAPRTPAALLEMLAEEVRCEPAVLLPGRVPEMVAGHSRLSEIDYRSGAGQSALGFALARLSSDAAPQLGEWESLYLAFEAAASSLGLYDVVERLQVPKWFVQLQIARVAGRGQDAAKLRDQILMVAVGKAQISELLQVERLTNNPTRAGQVPFSHNGRQRRRLTKVLAE
ncbi:uncharacterized protein V1510DRAFT_405152 [Dipodascopsis tothii]|uniref:uncharacterized protein n=1 Tax=Dipodascopsis tothii TaxID=44089 RepID=UPI0034CDDAB0